MSEDVKFKEGTHYELRDMTGTSYYFCLSCKRFFPRTYNPARLSATRIYGTRQLMALWAWYNFERHLKKCHKPCEVKEKEVGNEREKAE